MNKLSTEKRTQMLACLVEGNSLRATARMCDVAFIADHVWSLEEVVNLLNSK